MCRHPHAIGRVTVDVSISSANAQEDQDTTKAHLPQTQKNVTILLIGGTESVFDSQLTLQGTK